jgi:hypothetical protein
MGADGEAHYMSDFSLFVTFWTGAAIMLVAFFLAFRLKTRQSARQA